MHTAQQRIHMVSLFSTEICKRLDPAKLFDAWTLREDAAEVLSVCHKAISECQQN